MSRLQRNSNIVAVVLPFVATIAAIVLLWNQAVGWTDLAILATMYLVTGVGITVGYHRLLTHRAFQTHKPVEYALAAAGSMAVQGPVIDWVADHRKHHAHTDEEGDPHSPHVGHGSGLAGLWHAHVGWLFDSNGQADRRKYAPDLMDDRGMRLLNRRFVSLVGLSLGLPFALGWLLTGTLAGALTGLLWGGLVRIFFVHHITWSINSICHFHGTPPLRDRRPLDQRLVAVGPLPGRVLAPQPPRLPALGRAGPAPLGARPVRRPDLRDAEARACLERGAHQPGAPAAETRVGAPSRTETTYSVALVRLGAMDPHRSAPWPPGSSPAI